MKPNSSKVWERLKIDEQRLFKLESNVDKLDSKLNEKVEIMVNTETMVDAELKADTKIVQINNMIMSDAGLIADADVGIMADAELMIDTKLEQIDKRYFSLMRTPGMRSHGDSKLMAAQDNGCCQGDG